MANARHPNPLDLASILPGCMPDARIRYGRASPVQYADLRLPKMVQPLAGLPWKNSRPGANRSQDWVEAC